MLGDGSDHCKPRSSHDFCTYLELLKSEGIMTLAHAHI
jgi:hypothetical protein